MVGRVDPRPGIAACLMRPTAHSVSYVQITMILDKKLTLENLEEFCKLLRSYDAHDTQHINFEESGNLAVHSRLSAKVDR